MVSGKQRLEGKVAIVTGGGTGLGKIMALALAKEGADIVVSGRRVPPIEQTVKEANALGRRGLAIPTDVTDSQQVNQMVKRTLSQMGRIDILINNVGFVRGQVSKPIWDITDEEWHLGMDANLTGAFFCCRAVAQHLVAQKSGKVINMASIAGFRGNRNGYMYNIAKSGVIQLTITLAYALAQDNIQVNCMAPGVIDTSALQPEPQPRREGERGRFIPVGRGGIPQDVASLCLFLACDASDYITGGIFVIDGGVVAGQYAPTGYAPIITMKED